MRHTALSLHRTTSMPKSMADVTGYEVRTRDNNEKVGKVGDLVCATDGQVRYLDVTLGGLFNKKRVLLPVGLARVDKSNDVVWVASMNKEQVKALPEYGGDPEAITDDYEVQCCAPFLPDAARASAGAPADSAAAGRAADGDIFDQGRFYADRGGEAARAARLNFERERGEAERGPEGI